MNYKNKIFKTLELGEKKQEVFTYEFTNVETPKLFAQLMVVTLKEGIDRIENAIKNTYYQKDANKIIETLNLIFKNY
jgi:hypothetical protein